MTEEVISRKWMEQFRGIGEIAWTRCSADIRFVLTVVFGSSLIGLVFLSFWMLNAGINTLPLVNTVNFPGSITTTDALLAALFYAFMNTVCTVIFLTIVVCLFEYAYHFTYVAYQYDNESWEIPNMAKRAVKAFWARRDQSLANDAEKAFIAKSVLKQTISELKEEKP